MYVFMIISCISYMYVSKFMIIIMQSPVVTSAFVAIHGTPPKPSYAIADAGLHRPYLPRPQQPSSLYLRHSPSRISLSSSPMRRGRLIYFVIDIYLFSLHIK